jgi:hypothetical protein
VLQATRPARIEASIKEPSVALTIRGQYQVGGNREATP